MLSRRDWLRGVGLAAGALCVPSLAQVKPPSEDEHRVGGWLVRWSGWKLPANQAVKFGYWFAYRPEWVGVSDRARAMPIATTLGAVAWYRELAVIDTVRRDGWPCSEWCSAEAFESAKIRAYRSLVKELRAT